VHYEFDDLVDEEEDSVSLEEADELLLDELEDSDELEVASDELPLSVEDAEEAPRELPLELLELPA
jgi:hypothetical protein